MSGVRDTSISPHTSQTDNQLDSHVVYASAEDGDQQPEDAYMKLVPIT